MEVSCVDNRGHDWSDYCCKKCWVQVPVVNLKARMRARMDRANSHRILKERDGDFCFYCREKFEEYVLDHYIPKSKGGPDALFNRRLACIKCDRDKADHIPEKGLRGR